MTKGSIHDVPQNPLATFLQFLDRLEAANIWYSIERIRDSLMIYLAVPGERWEVEYFEDGHVEVERFLSTGSIHGEESFEQLFQDHSS